MLLNDRYNATIVALEKLDRERQVAFEKIERQAMEIERLIAETAAARRAQQQALSQVEKAICAINDARTRAAQAEAALDEERAERVRLAHELNVVSEQVGLLFDRLPAT